MLQNYLSGFLRYLYNIHENESKKIVIFIR